MAKSRAHLLLALGAAGLALVVGAIVGLLCRWNPVEGCWVSASGGGAAIQRAIDGLGAEGGLVMLPRGTFVCADPLIIRADRVSLRGEGPATVLRLADGANCPVIIIGDEAPAPRREMHDIRVSDLTIDGNRERQELECWDGVCDTGEKTVIRSSGVVLRRAVDVLVERVTVLRCRSAGLVTEKGCRRVTVRHFTTRQNHFDGLACYETTESLFADLHIQENEAAGISLDIHFDRNLVTNALLADNKGQGIFMRNSRDNVFQGLMITGSGQQGVFLAQVDKDTATGAEGNTFQAMTITTSKGPAVRVNDASCRHNLLSGCQFSGNAGGLSEVEPGLVRVESTLTR